jgi:hypothetical protein
LVGVGAVLDELCAPDCVDRDLAIHEEVRGLDATKQRVVGFRAAMPGLRVTIDDLVASGDRVVTRWHASATNDGELVGNPASHRHVEVTGGVGRPFRLWWALGGDARLVGQPEPYAAAWNVTRGEGSIIAVEVFEDEGARQRQESLPEVGKIMSHLPEILAAPPEATLFDVASSADAFAAARASAPRASKTTRGSPNGSSGLVFTHAGERARGQAETVANGERQASTHLSRALPPLGQIRHSAVACPSLRSLLLLAGGAAVCEDENLLPVVRSTSNVILAASDCCTAAISGHDAAQS